MNFMKWFMIMCLHDFMSAYREILQESRQHDKNAEIHSSFAHLCIPLLFGETLFFQNDSIILLYSTSIFFISKILNSWNWKERTLLGLASHSLFVIWTIYFSGAEALEKKALISTLTATCSLLVREEMC